MKTTFMYIIIGVVVLGLAVFGLLQGYRVHPCDGIEPTDIEASVRCCVETVCGGDLEKFPPDDETKQCIADCFKYQTDKLRSE
jgi:hypothetical protein